LRKTLKWTGIVVGTLLGVLLLGIFGLYAAGQMRLNKMYEVPFRTVALPEDAESLAEGKRIFQYRGCEACHGEDLEGLVYMDNPALGKVITPNLTTGPGGIGDERTDEDLVRAIQHGLRPDGTPLLFMPSTEFYYLSESDLGRVLAYIRSMPPVDNTTPLSELSFTGFVAMNIVRVSPSCRRS
jgi:mono/diheme cytochrome c family protein